MDERRILSKLHEIEAYLQEMEALRPSSLDVYMRTGDGQAGNQPPGSADIEKGYDVIGPGELELCTSSTSFAEMRSRGYDWFKLIGAPEMDGGGKGAGSLAIITTANLRIALEALERMVPDRLVYPEDASLQWKPQKEREDPFQFWATPLAAFMRGCLEWCEANRQDAVKIEFN